MKTASVPEHEDRAVGIVNEAKATASSPTSENVAWSPVVASENGAWLPLLPVAVSAAELAQREDVDTKEAQPLYLGTQVNSQMSWDSSERNKTEGRCSPRAPIQAADEEDEALTHRLEELLSGKRELQALRENFEMEKEAVLAEELRRVRSASAGLHAELLHILDKLGQTMDQEYASKVITSDISNHFPFSRTVMVEQISADCNELGRGTCS